MEAAAWIHDLLIALIASGVPIALLRKRLGSIHRQTKTSNGATLASMVERQGEIVNTMRTDQQTMKRDIGAIATYIGLTERERSQGSDVVTPLAKRRRH